MPYGPVAVDDMTDELALRVKKGARTDQTHLAPEDFLCASYAVSDAAAGMQAFETHPFTGPRLL
jgi:hypothetical protein